MSGEEADYLADGGYNPTDHSCDDLSDYFSMDPADRYIDDGAEDLDDREAAGYYDDPSEFYDLHPDEHRKDVDDMVTDNDYIHEIHGDN